MVSGKMQILAPRYARRMPCAGGRDKWSHTNCSNGKPASPTLTTEPVGLHRPHICRFPRRNSMRTVCEISEAVSNLWRQSKRAAEPECSQLARVTRLRYTNNVTKLTYKMAVQKYLSFPTHSFWCKCLRRSSLPFQSDTLNESKLLVFAVGLATAFSNILLQVERLVVDWHILVTPHDR